LAKAGLMCLNQQKYIYLTFMLTSAVVLQSPAFANILPLAVSATDTFQTIIPFNFCHPLNVMRNALLTFFD
jgi:hypothetical protein